MKLVSARARAAQLAAQAPRNILCLTVARLNADFLGAYGNTWIETPAFDALAAESVLFDSFYGTSLDLATLFRAFWRGESPREIVDELREEDEPTAPGSLFRALKEQGYRAYVVSDAREIAVHPAVEGDYCDGRFFLGEPVASEPASALDETKFYQNFEELARFIAKLEDGADSGDASPWFVWAHFSGWNAAWDFPLEARERYREDEEDPEPYAGAAPPYVPADALGGSNRRSRANLDADAAVDANDLRQSFVEAYAGGISVFDETLGGFTQLLRESGALAKTLFIVAGARGIGTGGSSALGFAPEGTHASPFYAEEVRLPLVARLPDGSGAATRLPALCEPRDLFETVRAWPTFAKEHAGPEFWKIKRSDVSPFAGVWSAETQDERGPKEDAENPDAPAEFPPDTPGQNLFRLLVDESGSVRDRVVTVAKDARSDERAIAVDGWFLKETPPANRETRDGEPAKPKLELFVLPDDRYNVNDVASRRPDAVERLAVALRDGKPDTAR